MDATARRHWERIADEVAPLSPEQRQAITGLLQAEHQMALELLSRPVRGHVRVTRPAKRTCFEMFQRYLGNPEEIQSLGGRSIIRNGEVCKRFHSCPAWANVIPGDWAYSNGRLGGPLFSRTGSVRD